MNIIIQNKGDKPVIMTPIMDGSNSSIVDDMLDPTTIFPNQSAIMISSNSNESGISHSFKEVEE